MELTMGGCLEKMADGWRDSEKWLAMPVTATESGSGDTHYLLSRWRKDYPIAHSIINQKPLTGISMIKGVRWGFFLVVVSLRGEL